MKKMPLPCFSASSFGFDCDRSEVVNAKTQYIRSMWRVKGSADCFSDLIYFSKFQIFYANPAPRVCASAIKFGNNYLVLSRENLKVCTALLNKEHSMLDFKNRGYPTWSSFENVKSSVCGKETAKLSRLESVLIIISIKMTRKIFYN